MPLAPAPWKTTPTQATPLSEVPAVAYGRSGCQMHQSKKSNDLTDLLGFNMARALIFKVCIFPQSFFYVTEHQEHRNHIFYFRKRVWSRVQEIALRLHVGRQFAPVSQVWSVCWWVKGLWLRGISHGHNLILTKQVSSILKAY